MPEVTAGVAIASCRSMGWDAWERFMLHVQAKPGSVGTGNVSTLVDGSIGWLDTSHWVWKDCTGLRRRWCKGNKNITDGTAVVKGGNFYVAMTAEGPTQLEAPATWPLILSTLIPSDLESGSPP